MISSLGGVPADVKPDPRYMIPYDNPVATPYPAAVVSPGGPAITPEPTTKSADKGTLSEAERKSPVPNMLRLAKQRETPETKRNFSSDAILHPNLSTVPK